MADATKLERLEAKVNRLTDMVTALARSLVSHVAEIKAADVLKGDSVKIDDAWSKVIHIRRHTGGKKLTFEMVSEMYKCRYQHNQTFGVGDVFEVKRPGLPPPV